MAIIDARTLPKASLAAACCMAFIIAACANIRPAEAEAASPVLSASAVIMPEYDSDRGITRASTRDAYEAVRADTGFVFEQISYTSDGLTVGAYVYRAATTNGRLPIVVFNRGGWVREGFGPEHAVQFRRYADAGFIVVAPWLRGSNGTEGRDEMGGADVNDVLNIVPVLRSLPYADAGRLFLLGESRGGMMSYQALRDGFPARAAAVYGAFGDLNVVLASPQGQAAAAHIWSDFEQNREALIERRSAHRWIDRINAPILIMHGSADGDAPVQAALDTDAALARAGKTHELRIFEGARHTLQDVAAERDAAAIAWFRRFDQR